MRKLILGTVHIYKHWGSFFQLIYILTLRNSVLCDNDRGLLVCANIELNYFTYFRINAAQHKHSHRARHTPDMNEQLFEDLSSLQYLLIHKKKKNTRKQIPVKNIHLECK